MNEYIMPSEFSNFFKPTKRKVLVSLLIPFIILGLPLLFLVIRAFLCFNWNGYNCSGATDAIFEILSYPFLLLFIVPLEKLELFFSPKTFSGEVILFISLIIFYLFLSYLFVSFYYHKRNKNI